MPINSISGLGFSKSKSVNLKADKTSAQKEATNEAPLTEKLKKSKLPYIAGGVVLAGMGVFLGRKYMSKLKNEPVIKDGLNELKDKLDDIAAPVVEDVKAGLNKVKEEVQEGLNKVKEEIKDVLNKGDDVINAGKAETPKVVVEAAPNKAKTKDAVEALNEMKASAEDVAIIQEAPAVVQKTAVEAEKKQAISGGVESLKVNVPKKETLATEAVPVNKTAAPLNKAAALNTPEIKAAVVKKNGLLTVEVADSAMLQQVKDFNKAHFEESATIIGANNWSGFVDVPKLEKVGRDFAADVNRPDNLKQAANLFEHSYKEAYINSYGNNTQVGLEKIVNRVTNESQDLFNIYAKMPKEDVLLRVKAWEQSLRYEGFTCVGMQQNEFADKILEALAARKII